MAQHQHAAACISIGMNSMLQNSADKADMSHIFNLKNRKFALTVDMARIPCGLNGAVYSAAIDAKGSEPEQAED